MDLISASRALSACSILNCFSNVSWTVLIVLEVRADAKSSKLTPRRAAVARADRSSSRVHDSSA